MRFAAALALLAQLFGCGAPTTCLVTVAGATLPADVRLSVFDRFGALTRDYPLHLGGQARFVVRLPSLDQPVRVALVGASGSGSIGGAAVSAQAHLETSVTVPLALVGSDPAHSDRDGDGVVDPLDNCAGTANPDQADSDGDGLGDACGPGVLDPPLPGTCVTTGCTFSSAPPAWLPTGPFPTGVSRLAAATGLDGHIYVMGGSNEPGPNQTVGTSQTFNYDPVTSQWTGGTPLGVARLSLAAARGADGRIYAVGGRDGANQLATAEAYDPTNHTWSNVASLPTARAGLALVAGRDGRLYAIGGENGGPKATVEVYDVESNSWSRRADMPTPRAGLAAALARDGRLYVAGGGSSSQPLNTVEIYDPVTDQWTSGPPLRTARAELGLLAGTDGRLYAIGGWVIGSSTDLVEALDLTANTWSVAAPTIESRAARGTAATLDGRLCVFGGTNFNPIPDGECFGPQASWATTLRGRAGESLAASGTNFAAAANLHIYFGALQNPLGTTVTDGSGAFPSLSISLPSVAPGRYPLVVVDDASHYPSVAQVEIVP